MTEYNPITVDNLRTVDFESIVSHIDNYRQLYHLAFENAARDIKDKDETSHKVFCLMASLTSLHLKPHNKLTPFGPMFVFNNRRSSIPDDFLKEELDALSKYLSEINDVELKSRIADIIWLRLRKVEFIEVGVKAYLESCTLIEQSSNSTGFNKRVERAIRLAAMTRRQNQSLFNFVLDFIKSKLKKHNGLDVDFLSIKLIELLLEFDFELETNDCYYNLSVKLAKNALEKQDWTKAEAAWRIAEKCAIKLKHIENANNALINLSETYEKEAACGDSAIFSSHWLQKAVEVLKGIPNIKNKQKQLYQKLREQQKLSTEQVSIIEGEGINLKDCVTSSRQSVSCKNLQDALFNFVFRVAHIPNYKSLKIQAVKDQKKYIAHHLFGSVHTDQEGFVIAQIPASIGLKEKENSRGIWCSILESAKITHNISVHGCIEPAREIISLEHNINEESLLIVVQHNPFIKKGYEYLFAKGLVAGFNEDYITAIHILIPQIENSLRYILEQCGISTTYFHDGVQKSKLLRALLEETKLEEVFGKDILLDLQGLLIDPLYANLRNEIMHGKFLSTYFQSIPVIYFWWLSLKIVILPFYKEWKFGEEE